MDTTGAQVDEEERTQMVKRKASDQDGKPHTNDHPFDDFYPP